MVNALPDGPNLHAATQESKLLGKLELPNVFRPAARPGIAFVGDAALAADPLWGVGCGWAFQSADWLVKATADALGGGRDLDAALERYRRVHRRRLLPHYLMICDIASGRPINPIERRLYSVDARDPVVLHAFEDVGSRRRSPGRMLDPRVLARLARRAGASADKQRNRGASTAVYPPREHGQVSVRSPQARSARPSREPAQDAR
jgi:menaquinone-9 beta-reductase